MKLPGQQASTIHWNAAQNASATLAQRWIFRVAACGNKSVARRVSSRKKRVALARARACTCIATPFNPHLARSYLSSYFVHCSSFQPPTPQIILSTLSIPWLSQDETVRTISEPVDPFKRSAFNLTHGHPVHPYSHRIASIFAT